jgi:hypothetical protein
MRLIGLVVVLAVRLLLAPLATEAQQAGKIWRIGILSGAAPASQGNLAALLQGLREAGLVEGRNVIFEIRCGQADALNLPVIDTTDLGIEAAVDALVPYVQQVRAERAAAEQQA